MTADKRRTDTLADIAQKIIVIDNLIRETLNRSLTILPKYSANDIQLALEILSKLNDIFTTTDIRYKLTLDIINSIPYALPGLSYEQLEQLISDMFTINEYIIGQMTYLRVKQTVADQNAKRLLDKTRGDDNIGNGK